MAGSKVLGGWPLTQSQAIRTMPFGNVPADERRQPVPAAVRSLPHGQKRIQARCLCRLVYRGFCCDRSDTRTGAVHDHQAPVNQCWRTPMPDTKPPIRESSRLASLKIAILEERRVLRPEGRPTWSADGEHQRVHQNQPQQGPFFPDLLLHSLAMGQEGGVLGARRSQKWTAATDVPSPLPPFDTHRGIHIAGKHTPNAAPHTAVLGRNPIAILSREHKLTRRAPAL